MRRYRALENRGPHDRAQAPAILGKFKKVCRVGRKPFPPLRTLSGALCPSALQTPLRSTCVPFRPPSDPGGSSPMRGAPCTEHHVYRRITAFSRPAPVGPARASKAGRVDINPAQLGHVWTRRRKACCGPHVTCGVSHRTSGRTKALRCDCANAPRPPLEEPNGRHSGPLGCPWSHPGSPRVPNLTHLVAKCGHLGCQRVPHGSPRDTKP